MSKNLISTKHINIYLTDEQYEFLYDKAKKNRKRISPYIKQILFDGRHENSFGNFNGCNPILFNHFQSEIVNSLNKLTKELNDIFSAIASMISDSKHDSHKDLIFVVGFLVSFFKYFYFKKYTNPENFKESQCRYDGMLRWLVVEVIQKNKSSKELVKFILKESKLKGEIEGEE